MDLHVAGVLPAHCAVNVLILFLCVRLLMEVISLCCLLGHITPYSILALKI